MYIALELFLGNIRRNQALLFASIGPYSSMHLPIAGKERPTVYKSKYWEQLPEVDSRIIEYCQARDF